MRCRITCDKEVYPWAIGEFIEKFSTTYLKLETLRTVLQLYSEYSSLDENIFIKTRNIDIFKQTYISSYIADVQSSIISYSDLKQDKYFLFGKNESPEMFWNIFEKNTRPDVYIKYHQQYLPIIDIPNSQFKFTKIEVNSPPFFELTGAASSILDIFYAGEREDRSRLSFQNGMIDQSLDNLQGIIRTAQVIESAQVSPSLKAYANHQLSTLMAKQNKINENIGVKELRIDELA